MGEDVKLAERNEDSLWRPAAIKDEGYVFSPSQVAALNQGCPVPSRPWQFRAFNPFASAPDARRRQESESRVAESAASE
jgi:hypothetical protein